MKQKQHHKMLRDVSNDSLDPLLTSKMLNNFKNNLFSDGPSKIFKPFIGIHSSEKVPSNRSHLGISTLLKNLPLEEWISGSLSKKTINKIIAKLHKKRKGLKDPSELKINIIPNLGIMLRRYYMKTKTKPSKDLFNKFMKRSLALPVKITSTPADLIFCDVINGEPTGEYNIFNGSNGIMSLQAPFGMRLMMAYKGTDAQNKHSRAMIRIFRTFDRQRHIDRVTVINDKWHLGVVDIVGPIRQQKHIMKMLSKLALENNIKLYIPDEIKHRFRCDFEFQEKPEKLITAMVDQSILPGNGNFVMPSYQTLFVKSRALKTKGWIYCLIKKAWEIK